MNPLSERYQIALSFAGEQRPLVSAVADRLAEVLGRDQVFYDRFHEARLAQPNLDVLLQEIYHDRSQLVVVFLGADYERKEWCGLEWRGVRDLIKSRQDTRIMLVRVDGAVVPGLFGIDGYLDASGRSPVEIAERILERLGQVEGKAASPPKPSFPSEEIQRLSETLEAAHLRKEELTVAGGDTRVVEQEILALRRQMREGGRLQVGDILAGRFRLVELLGSGGFATVWKAYDRRERGLVAVKVLHGQFGEDRTRLDRFFRGARKMAELQHEGIVRVLEKRLDDGGYHFFVMEYVPGGDLRQAVLAKRLAPERVLPLVGEVAAALGFAHQKGVVHRDVKPANILLDAEGKPKLTDFDLVWAPDTTGGTLAGGMMGTFLYTAPEAMGNPQEAGVAADVYSLAMTAAFCLFGAELPVEVLRNTEKFVRKLPCPDGVRATLKKAAAWLPEERFGSVVEFFRALEKGDGRVWSLEKRLETEIPELPEAKRATATLQAVEAKLPLAPEDLRTLGMAAWAIDYFAGRSHSPAEREDAGIVRQRMLAPHRERFPPGRLEDRAWVAIPGGHFLMSRPFRLDGEPAARRVTISSFWIAPYPVTNREYRRFSPDQEGDDEFPAVNVSWYAAYAYAAWLGGRLPTDAEWEYAARGGSPHKFSARDGSPTTPDQVGWHSGNSGWRLHPVGMLEPNPWGLYDMYGNVSEWVADWHHHHSKAPVSDPWGPPPGGYGGRVHRGGDWGNDAGSMRATARSFSSPWIMLDRVGFRVLLPGGPRPVKGRR